MNFKERLLKSEIIRSVLVLMTGTVLAQLISYVAIMVISWIYSKEEVGDLGIYMRTVSFIAAVGTLRFEASLPLGKHEGHSFLLYKLSLRIATIILAACTFGGFLYFLVQPTGIQDVWFGLITLASAFFVVFINLGTNWSIRNKEFKKISRQRIVNSFSGNGLRIVFGMIGMGSIGLLLGTLIGYAVSSSWYIRDFLRLDKSRYPKYSKKKQRVLVRENREFPLVNLPHVTLDVGRDMIIAYFISYHFSQEIFGVYYHAMMILAAPLSIIGVSIGQVLFNRFSELANSGKPTFLLVRKTLLILLSISVVPFTSIFFFGEELFTFIFTAKWADSGFFSEIMAFWLMMLFVVSPLSSLPLVLRRQKEFFFISFIGSGIQLVGFGVLPFVIGNSSADWEQILWFVALAQIGYFTFVGLMYLYYAKKGVKGAVTN